MRPFAYRLLAAGSVACLAVLAAAATRPHYGGTLRVEIQAKVSSLDPSEWPEVAEADAILKLRELIYDRLVRLDRHGQPQPAIALSWERDAQAAQWRLKLRPGVKWQDGAPLTPEEVLSALEGMAPGGSFHLAGDTLEIDMGRPQPDLLVALATDPGWMIRRPAVASADTLPVGTGPFRLTAWEAGHHAVLGANDDYWDGRPYLDTIEIQMGRSSRDQLLDLEVDKSDLVELDPSEARRAQPEGKRVWTSAPVELFSARFDLNKPVVQDRRLREAIADSIDRGAIQKVLLQNYGEATGSILPQWISGYSFLFPVARDLQRSRQLTAEIGTPPTLKLGYDSNDALARQMAERIAVNARDAGVTLQVSPLPAGWRRMPDTGTDLHVERTRIDGPAFEEAVREAISRLGFSTGGKADTPEQVYSAERKLLDSFRDVPLVYSPELIGIGPRVKDWSALPWGDWRLPDAWLEAEKP
jgi:peptide/nickel transport system substrate-binding protein